MIYLYIILTVWIVGTIYGVYLNYTAVGYGINKFSEKQENIFAIFWLPIVVGFAIYYVIGSLYYRIKKG